MKQEPILEIDGGISYHILDGKLHREDGPTTISPDGSEQWYLYGKLHRENGPAMKLFNRQFNYSYYYFLEGNEYTEEEWKEEIFKRNLQKILK